MMPIDYYESQCLAGRPYSPPAINNWCVGVDYGVENPTVVVQCLKLEPLKLPAGKTIYDMAESEDKNLVLTCGRATKKSFARLKDFRLGDASLFNDPVDFADHLRELGVGLPEGSKAWVTDHQVRVEAGDPPVVTEGPEILFELTMPLPAEPAENFVDRVSEEEKDILIALAGAPLTESVLLDLLWNCDVERLYYLIQRLRSMGLVSSELYCSPGSDAKAYRLTFAGQNLAIRLMTKSQPGYAPRESES